MIKLKLVVVGDPAVGKTTLVTKYSTKKFEKDYKMTVGFQISKIEKEIKGTKVQFMIHDIAGQERFKIMRHRFYAGSDGCLIVFDLTNRDSLKNIEMWFKECRKYAENDNVKYMLIGNKHDLERTIPKKIPEKVGSILGMPYYETSAKTGLHVNKIFAEIFAQSQS